MRLSCMRKTFMMSVQLFLLTIWWKVLTASDITRWMDDFSLLLRMSTMISTKLGRPLSFLRAECSSIKADNGPRIFPNLPEVTTHMFVLGHVNNCVAISLVDAICSSRSESAKTVNTIG